MGGKFGAGPGWTLVTGERNQIDRLLKALGVYTANITDHSPLVLLGDEPARRWTRAYGLAAPAKLAELIDSLAAPGADGEGVPPMRTCLAAFLMLSGPPPPRPCARP